MRTTAAIPACKQRDRHILRRMVPILTPKELEIAKTHLCRLYNEQLQLCQRVESAKRSGSSRKSALFEQNEVQELLNQTGRQLALITELVAQQDVEQRAKPTPNDTTMQRRSQSEVATEMPRKVREAHCQTESSGNPKQPAKRAGTSKVQRECTCSANPDAEKKPVSRPNVRATPKSTSASLKHKRLPPQSWFIPLHGSSLSVSIIDPNARVEAQTNGYPRRVTSVLRMNDTPRSSPSGRSSRSSSASPPSRSRSPTKILGNSREELVGSARASEQLRSLSRRAKVDRIAQVWAPKSRSVTPKQSVGELEIMYEVCATVRKLQRAFNTERRVREKNEAVVCDQRDMIGALTSETIEAQQRLAALATDFDAMHRAVVPRIGPIPISASTQSIVRRYQNQAGSYDELTDRLANRLGNPSYPDSDYLHLEPELDRQALSSSASVLKEVDRLKRHYSAIQSRLNSVLQRSAETLRQHGASSPTRSPDERGVTQPTLKATVNPTGTTSVHTDANTGSSGTNSTKHVASASVSPIPTDRQQGNTSSTNSAEKPREGGKD